MKTLLIWIWLMSFMAFTIWAATITINVPSNDLPRLSEAFGRFLGLTNPDGTRRTATQQEITDFLRSELIGVTYGYEGRKNLPSPTPLEMQPTPTPTPTATPTSTP